MNLQALGWAMRFLFVEEVDETAVPVDPADPVAVFSSDGDTQGGWQFAGAGHECGAQICKEGRGGEDRRESSLQASEMSMGKMTLQPPGWAKRVRIGTGAHYRKPCPLCVTAFEEVLGGYAENPSENVIVPMVIRYKKSRANMQRLKGMQEIVCRCSGKALNLYDTPLRLFVGVNNNFQSIILAGALVCDETEERFVCVFQTFYG